jgi:hypothetical protein
MAGPFHYPNEESLLIVRAAWQFLSHAIGDRIHHAYVSLELCSLSFRVL